MFYLVLPLHLAQGAFVALPAVLFGILIGCALGAGPAAARGVAPPWDAAFFALGFALLVGGAIDAVGVFQVDRTGIKDPGRVARPRMQLSLATAILFAGLIGFGRLGGWVGLMAMIAIAAVYNHRKLRDLPAPGAATLEVVLISLLVVVAMVEPTGVWRALVQ